MGQYQRKGKKRMKEIDFRFDNVGGMTALYLLPPSDIRRIDENPSSGTVVPIMRSRANIYRLTVFDGDAFSFEENMSIEDGGSAFDVTISGVLPRLDNMASVAELEQGEWLAVHQDANGTILLSGSKEVPLRFITQKKSGGATSRNGVAFTLQATEPEASRVCEGRAIEP